MSTGMRKWMEKDCPEIEYPPAQVLIDREELKQLLDRLKATEEDRSNFLVEMGKLCAQCDALRAKIEEAESDALEQARLNGMGSEREAALMAKLEAAEKERDALRAKIAEMEQQEPVMWANSSNIASARINHERGTVGDQHTCAETKTAYHDAPLYAFPGAQTQPAPSVPVDVITDYLVSISAHVAHQEEPKAQAEIGELLRMLAAAPEAKP